jgi:putative tryptophan/tyrosine transport system substrate-binding protein
MKRRSLVVSALAAGFVSTSITTLAQKTTRRPRIGYLAPSRSPYEDVFWQELRRLGYTDGKTLAVEYRSADGDFTLLPALANQLVDLNVDVIVAQVTQAAIAAGKATKTIPIVMIGVSDPVASGLVASLGRPGGNVTGTSAVAAGVVGKQLELLRDLLPGIAQVAVLWNPANSIFQEQQLKEAKEAAAELRMHLKLFKARSPVELDHAVATIAQDRPAALLVLQDPLFATHAKRIADLAIKHRLPAVSGARVLAEAGLLMTYAPDYQEAYRRAAGYVDRVIKGDRPADLAVERSTRFELVVNTTTATKLGLTLPQSLLLRADHVVKH